MYKETDNLLSIINQAFPHAPVSTYREMLVALVEAEAIALRHLSGIPVETTCPESTLESLWNWSMYESYLVWEELKGRAFDKSIDAKTSFCVFCIRKRMEQQGLVKEHCLYSNSHQCMHEMPAKHGYNIQGNDMLTASFYQHMIRLLESEWE